MIESVKRINPKKMMYAFNLVFILALIGVMTMANLLIDIEHFDFYKWLTNCLIYVGIQIPSIILGELISKDRAMENPDGKYQRAIARFKATENGWEEENGRVHMGMRQIKLYFSQFFYWFKQRDLENMKVQYLISNDIDGLMAPLIVKHINKDNFEEIKQRTMAFEDEKSGKVEIVKKLTDEEAVAVGNMLNGAVKIRQESYAYYLSYDRKKKTTVSILDEGKQINDDIKSTTAFRRSFGIATHIIFSVIWAMVIVESASDMGSTQTWLNLISRLTAFVAGLTSGFTTSVSVVKMEAAAINNICDVREMYIISYENGEFKPETYEQEILPIAEKEVAINETKKS